MNTNGARFLQLTGVYPDYGILLLGTNTGALLDSVIIQGGGRARYGFISANGNGNIQHNMTINGQTIPFVDAGGTGGQFNNMLVTPNGSTSLYGSIFIQSSDTISGLYFDNETSSLVWLANIVLVQPAGFQLFKGEIDGMSNQGTAVWLDGGTGSLFDGSSFGNTNVSPEVFNVISGPSSGTNTARGVTAPGSAVPLSNDVNFVSVGN